MLTLLIAIAAGFATTLILTPMARVFLTSSGIVGIDQQKLDTPTLPTSGGITVLFGFLVSLTVYLGLTTFVNGGAVRPELLLAALSSTLIIALIGLIDDIHVKADGEAVKERTQLSIGFKRWWIKPLFVLPAALPLMVVKAGDTTMYLPLLGPVEWGLLYPLLLVPVALVAVSNATNMLAGQNGLEATLGGIALTAVGAFALLHGRDAGGIIALSMAAPLAAFLVYNRYPSSILPGDSLTYAIGAAYAAAVIVADVEFFGVIVFLPWILEAFLKLRSRFQASSLGELQADGTLAPLHDRIYSLTHVAMRLNVTEPQLVAYLAAAELIIVAVAFAAFL